MDAARQREMLRRVAAEDPDLAARLVLMTLPGAARRLDGRLVYDLTVHGVGAYRVQVADGNAWIGEPDGDADVDFRLALDPQGLVELATGSSGPLGLMLGGRMRIRGRRRRALKLRQLGSDATDLGDVLDAGGTLDPDLLYHALPYMVDPPWTAGHRFTVVYEVTGEPGGTWYVQVRDGEPLTVTSDAPGPVDATVRLAAETYQQLAGGKLTAADAMREQLTEIEGKIHPVTLLGRWIDRSQGRDEAELAREERQRAVQEGRAGAYGNGAAPAAQGDPGADGGGDGKGLLGYRQLYALWEGQNWKATEIDFSVDREHWLATPSDAQENTLWSLGSFYVGEERVTADLAPFLLAAPSGEIELFLGTQLVDEARHAAFFDRFGAEVMALSAEDMRGRMREVEQILLPAWREVFDDGLRDVSRRLQQRPYDFDLFVEGIATYHIVIEGFLAVTGQAMIRQYMLDHGLYPGFCEGFGLVERDEHRHIAFGVRFLKDAIDDDPRHRETVERTVFDLSRRAAYVFAPPYVTDATEFVSYGYHSSEIYGYAYRALKRRMRVLGIETPPPEELMPGPIAAPTPVATG
jgi:ribonucleoside-diphosphate reductase beta chain